MSQAVMTRREFLAALGLGTAGVLAGCAKNPATGESQLMLMSQNQEIQLDRENSPHQFSADYGPTQDQGLNKYIRKVGLDVANHSHRTDMPYSFRVVDATYVNAYAFPGGSIAATRGIMLTLENEAELAALLGHEIGHVNARHTASRMSKAMLTQAAAVGLTVGVANSSYREFTPLAAGLGSVGAGALLASYSRSDERQADELGMQYMVRAGYTPQGMVGLQEHLVAMHKEKPSAVSMLFATHPMSEERRDTALARANTTYASAKNLPLYRERYMDNTAALRAKKAAIEAMQKGEKAMVNKKYPEAEGHFKTALQQASGDYAALVMMAKCQIAMGKNKEAEHYAELAKQAKPSEAQALNVAGLAKLQMRQFNAAYADFGAYEKRLPGNASTTFYRAVCLDNMGHKKQAANQYYRYLQAQREGSNAKFAYGRLVKMGYVQ